MSIRKAQFDKDYPKEIIHGRMIAVSVTVNVKTSMSDEVKSEETPIYMTTPQQLPIIANHFLQTKMKEIAETLPLKKKKKKKAKPETEDDKEKS
jgi:hypothetical protein